MHIVTTQSKKQWLAEVDTLVFDNLGEFTLMLTGGRSAKKLYEHWSKGDRFSDHRIDCYFGDERCVPLDDAENNYGMVMNTLFAKGVPAGLCVYRMRGEQANIESEISRYCSALPSSLDVILLSVGEDGHIASIFPNSEVVHEQSALVSHVRAPKIPQDRLTVTPKVLKSAKKIIVLVCGAVKGKVVARALKQPKNVQELPIAIVMGMSQTTIILDKEASEQLQ